MESHSPSEASNQPPHPSAPLGPAMLSANDVLMRARNFAEPILGAATLDTGENMLDHADKVAEITQRMGGSIALQVASYLIYVFDYLNKPHEVIIKGFGHAFADLAFEANKLLRLERLSALGDKAGAGFSSAESVRKLLLAFSKDVRVVLLRLASRLQTLRYHASEKKTPLPSLVYESLHVYASLANRLGLWEIKWELEDLAFRFSEPTIYKEISRKLASKRVERERYIAELKTHLETGLNHLHIPNQVKGRPKHIYSIVKKMRGKNLDFEDLYDLSAFRILVKTVADCYRVLAWVNEEFPPLHAEFSDYIARPKPNGYQSLHAVVLDHHGHHLEIQIRTFDMHANAETGIAAHWVYKEAGTKGYSGLATATSSYESKIAVLRQLLSWEQDVTSECTNTAMLDERIYVFTPDAKIIDLPKHATPIDFAYHVHTTLGHRCRGARVDGALLSLNTPLKSGQTVEIMAAKEGGPSRDWLNPELGFLISQRAKSKVRAWFNTQQLEITIAKGRETVEKILQRLGKTSINLEQLAQSQDCENAQKLFELVGKDEHSLRKLEHALTPALAKEPKDHKNTVSIVRPTETKKKNQKKSTPDDVLVVGVGSLLTTLAKCCKPIPPDPICGFITRGQGVSIHRASCINLKNMVLRSPERIVEVSWGESAHGQGVQYAVDFIVEATEGTNLIRDICDRLAKEKIPIQSAQTLVVKGIQQHLFTVSLPESDRLHAVWSQLRKLPQVLSVRRR